MTKPDWPSIKADYVETRMTLAEVQEKWGVPRGTLSAHATRHGWNASKQQFAANLEQTRQDKIIAKTAEEQAKFQANIARVAHAQLAMIARQMQQKDIDVPKLLKLTNALANVQRVGEVAFGIGATAPAAAPAEAGSASASGSCQGDVDQVPKEGAP